MQQHIFELEHDIAFADIGHMLDTTVDFVHNVPKSEHGDYIAKSVFDALDKLYYNVTRLVRPVCL